MAYGESLGTASPPGLPCSARSKALVLEAPFTSVVDVGRQVWWFLPLRLVMTDQYRTIDRIGSVKVPLLHRPWRARRDDPGESGAARLCRGERAEDARHPAAAGTTTICSTTALGQKVAAFLDAREPVRPAIVRPVYVEQVALAVVAARLAKFKRHSSMAGH